MSPLPHILLAVGAATLAGAVWAGIAGFLKATVGAHEVISTIMLNWIAIWVGEWLFGDGGPLQNSADKSVADLERRRRLRQAAGVLGRAAAAGPRSASSSRSPRSSSSGRSSTGRRSATRCAPSGSTPRRRRTAASASRKNLIRAMAISGGFAGPRRCAGHDWATSTTSGRATSRSAPSASSASPSRCSAATPRPASASARCSSARCSSGRRTASPRT